MDPRLVPFEGTTNFRDLGGYPTAGGGHTRWRVLYRADGLQDLTATDLEQFAALGIRQVYDLRRDAEREQRPNPMSAVAVCVASPIDEAGAGHDSTAVVGHHGGELLLRTMYSNMLQYSGAVIGTVFRGLAEPDGLPAVFHCHGGKDRTGLLAALLLDALGVERGTVLDDYVLTMQYRKREHQHSSYEQLVANGVPPEAAAGVLGAPRWAMQEALDDLDQRYGGSERYLIERAGVDAATIARLREALVEG